MISQTQTSRKGEISHVILLVFSIGYILVANYYSEDQALLAGNITYIPVTIAMIISSIYFLLEFRKKISMVVLVSLVVSTTSWFVAAVVWTVEEMILQIEPFPSYADIFYILGYPFLLIFLYNVGKTTKAPIQIRIVSAAVSLAFLIPTMTAALTIYDDDPLDFILTATYTVFDALLIWVILNNVLTINNRQNAFWMLMFVGVGLMLIGDSFFIVLAISGEYYTGHLIEVFFLTSYVAISYALFYQVKMSRKEKWEKPAKLFSPDRPITNFLQNIILVSSSVVVIIAVSLIMILGFEEFTTNEATTFSTLMVASITIVVVLSALTYVLDKKLSRLRQLQKRYDELPLPGEVQPSYSTPTLLARIERLERNNKRMRMVTLFGVLVTVIMSASYISENFFDLGFESETLQTGRYVVENIKGKQVESDTLWKINPEESLQIYIVNSDLVSADKIAAIKEAILSEETIDIPNSEMGKVPEDLVATYYLGWRGALQEASQEQTVFPIPTEFQIFESDETMGDINIILSDQKQDDGIVSFTKLIVDEGESQILKVYMTILDARNLRSHDFEDIVRHEFGHAIGLKHENDVNINLHEGHAYISQCNIENVVKLYKLDFSHTQCQSAKPLAS